jgi:starch synthase
MEFFGDVNLLKGGLIYADALTTVSERYAAEVMTAEYGRGMESVIHANRHRLVGILNGVDYQVWNPAVDTNIPSQYSTDDLTGKGACKAALQKEFGLPTEPHIPLLASLSRFDDQKGIDLVYGAMEVMLLEGEVQLVLLGDGKPEYERLFGNLIARFPNQVSVSFTHDEDQAHRMIAGSDFILMPSRYEPCGLVQLCSLKYGTPAIVRQAGGLADAIRDYNDAQRDGYGFVFHQPDPKDFVQAVRRALAVYRDKTAWVALQRRGMARDFSWQRTAERYDALFHQLVEPQN